MRQHARRRAWLRWPLIGGLLLLLTLWLWPGRSTVATARAYLHALQAGDLEGARALYRGDPWCSAPSDWDTIDAHLILLAGRRLRRIEIEPVDIGGSVAYPPGSEAASIRLELETSDGAWQPVRLGVATGPARRTQNRMICYLTGP